MPKGKTTGIVAALVSSVFLGFTPIFGKLAINFGFTPLAVVALRTSLAAGLILIVVALFYRSFLYIFPIGLVGCLLAGAINGLGSILYYLALDRLSASVGQMLYSIYPFFVALWLILDHQMPSRLTILRISLAILAVVFLTSMPASPVDPIGVAMMLGAAALYALHLPINQRVLYEVPAPTVTLYTLLAMSAVVVPSYLLFHPQWPTENMPWWPVIGLTLVTTFSRLSLFLGVKHIGGMQTALLGLSELLVTLILSHVWLHESLLGTQWLGALGLIISLLLVRYERASFKFHSGKTGWLSWIRPPDIPRDIQWGPHE